MPLIVKENIQTYGELGIWRIEEDISYFEARVDIHPDEKQQMGGIRDRKLKEWYASRYLLHLMSGRNHRGICLKDTYGKPYLKDSPFSISLSHSRDLIAVVAAAQIVGVDIQYIVPKIAKIAPKFISPLEYDFVSSKHEIRDMHYIWGIKESLYKAYGKGQLAFKEHMRIQKMTCSEKEMEGEAIIMKEDVFEKYQIFGRVYNEYVLVYVVLES